jgi:hydrogenase maturation factor
LLKQFITGKLSIPQIIPTLEKFEAAYAYYQLIARKNKIASPFNKKVVEAYWLGNELLDKFTAKDLQELIIGQFCRPGLLSKKEARKRAALVPANSKPHHSFHVLVLGSITGRVDFTGNAKLKDTCRVGWGRVIKKSKITSARAQGEGKNQKTKLIVSYNPLIGEDKIKLGRPIKKMVNWDKEILPKVKIGDWVSFHWDYAIQKLNEQNIVNLYKYTQNTLTSLYGRR